MGGSLFLGVLLSQNTIAEHERRINSQFFDGKTIFPSTSNLHDLLELYK